MEKFSPHGSGRLPSIESWAPESQKSPNFNFSASPTDFGKWVEANQRSFQFHSRSDSQTEAQDRLRAENLQEALLSLEAEQMEVDGGKGKRKRKASVGEADLKMGDSDGSSMIRDASNLNFNSKGKEERVGKDEFRVRRRRLNTAGENSLSLFDSQSQSNQPAPRSRSLTYCPGMEKKDGQDNGKGEAENLKERREAAEGLALFALSLGKLGDKFGKKG